MASSQARIEANRRNALKSTGPKTAEGKERSRANALKHGLTGAGVVIAADDAAKVDAMEAKLAADFEPANEAAASLVRRYAVLSVRLDRCADHDAAMTARRVRRALADHDNQRHDEVAGQAARLGDDPFDAVRRLKQTPEGLDWLIGQWEEVRIELADPACHPAAIADRAGMLLGLSPTRARVSLWAAWARSTPAEKEATGPAGWADAEIAALQALRAEVDDEAEAADRDEAAARALFDFGPEAERMRRYEAAAERHLFRTLRELRQLQREAGVKIEPKPAPPPAPAPAPLSPARVLESFTAAERRILGDLPAPVRELALEFGNYIDVAAIPAAVAAVREQRDGKSKRPRLR